MRTANIFRTGAPETTPRQQQSEWQRHDAQSKAASQREWRPRDIPGLQHEHLGTHAPSSLQDREGEVYDPLTTDGKGVTGIRRQTEIR